MCKLINFLFQLTIILSLVLNLMRFVYNITLTKSHYYFILATKELKIHYIKPKNKVEFLKEFNLVN